MPKITATQKCVKAALTAEDRRHLEYVHTKIGQFCANWMADNADVSKPAGEMVASIDAFRKAMIREEAKE